MPFEEKEQLYFGRAPLIKNDNPPLEIQLSPQKKNSNIFSTAKNVIKKFILPIKKSQHGGQSKQSEFYEFLVTYDMKVQNYKEGFLHLFFMLSFVGVLFLQRDILLNYTFNNGIKGVFITPPTAYEYNPFPTSFMDIQSYGDIANFLLGFLGPTLDASARQTDPATQYFFNGNRLLGAVRVRQLKVRPDYCQVSPVVVAAVGTACYPGFFLSDAQQTDPFGPPGNETKYLWWPKSMTGASARTSFLSTTITYDPSGYVTDLPLGCNYTDALQELVDDAWYDRSTRVIFITLNFLNPSLNYRLGTMELTIEITAGGLIAPNYYFTAFPMFQYIGLVDYVCLAAEIIFITLLLYFLVRFFYDLFKTGFVSFFWPLSWNHIELVNLALYVVVVGLFLNYLAHIPQDKSGYITESYINLNAVSKYSQRMYEFCAFNIFISFIRTFKYLKLNRNLYILQIILADALPDLMRFGFIFIVLLLAFIFMGQLSFGGTMGGFKTFGSAFGACFNFLLGSPPSFEDLFASNRILGPFFYVTFVIFIVIILFNTFIAILSGKYDAQAEKSAGSEDSSFSLAELKAEVFFITEMFRKDRLPCSQFVTTELCTKLDQAWDDAAFGKDDLLQKDKEKRLPADKRELLRARRIRELKYIHAAYMKQKLEAEMERKRKAEEEEVEGSSEESEGERNEAQTETRQHQSSMARRVSLFNKVSERISGMGSSHQSDIEMQPMAPADGSSEVPYSNFRRASVTSNRGKPGRRLSVKF